MSKWISVKDRLPAVGDWSKNHVLTANDIGRFRVAYYDGTDWRTAKDEKIGWLSPIVYWMPIQPIPEDGAIG